MISIVSITSITIILSYLYRTRIVPSIISLFGIRDRISPVPGITFFEVLSALFSTLLTLYFPTNQYPIVLALLLTWGLLMLSYVDLYYLILPNLITWPLWILGIVVQAVINNAFLAPVLESFLAYSTMWLVAHIYYSFTNRIGLGGGDIKLFGALGAWFGIKALPFILCVASVSGVCAGLIRLLWTHQKYHTPIPFGPFLALGGWLYLMKYEIFSIKIY